MAEVSDFTWINAKIFMYPIELGGKTWNIKNNYHPNLIWGFNDSVSHLIKKNEIHLINHREYGAKAIDGLFYFDEEKELGTFFTSKIRMSKEEWLNDYLQLGSHFLIREGRKIVGFGILLEETSAENGL